MCWGLWLNRVRTICCSGWACWWFWSSTFPGLSSLSQAISWLLWLDWFGLTEESLGQGQCVSTIEDPKTRAHRLINAINLCAPVVVSPHSHHSRYSQRASHPRPPDFYADLWGNSRGSSLWEYHHNFPAGIRQMEGNFLCGYFPWGIPGEISTWKSPLCFPEKFQNAI